MHTLYEIFYSINFLTVTYKIETKSSHTGKSWLRQLISSFKIIVKNLTTRTSHFCFVYINQGHYDFLIDVTK